MTTILKTISDTIELYQYPSDCEIVVGLDEVGRGPLAGPVVAAAVVFRIDAVTDGITDSKKISARRRQQLVPVIKQQALAWGLGRCSASEIDRLNILQASLLAMRRAYLQLHLTVPADLALVDGTHVPKLPIPSQAVIKGDARVPVIGAASILAKEVRDAEMVALHQRYPQYGFDRHKGYPTRAHREALQKFGPTEQHRTSFAPVKRILQEQK